MSRATSPDSEPASQPDTRAWRWAAGFGFAVAAAYVWLDDFSLLRMTSYQLGRTDVDNPGFNAVAYAGPYLLGLLSLALLHGHARAGVRYPTHLVAIVSIATFFGFATVSDRGFSITEATQIWAEIEFVPSAVQFFFWDYGPALLASALVVGLVEWLVRPRLPALRARWVLVFPLLAAFMFYRLLVVTDAKVEQSPLPFRVPVLVAYAYANPSVYLGARDDVYLPPPHREPIAAHIVLIVDESIRGDWLGLNGAELPTSPYLDSIADRVFNYGVMSAIANLSAPAHILLQSGLRPDELPDTELRSMKNPLVFSYMRQAGFRTYLINAQNALARPPNFMTDADVAALDGYWQVRNLVAELEEHEPDQHVVPMIEQILDGSERSFTYVIKNGAHFPYTRKFPPDQAVFDAAAFVEQYGEGPAQTIAEYLNTVLWSVDGFLKPLLAALAGHEGVLVVYTADHGQSLYEPLGPGVKPIRGHGQHDHPPSYQAMVPLFLVPQGAAVRARVAAAFDPALRDRISAFELFPSLLVMAGYDLADVRARYHHTIFEPAADRDRRVFISGNHFGADGPLYRDAPYRSSFSVNLYDPRPHQGDRPVR